MEKWSLRIARAGLVLHLLIWTGCFAALQPDGDTTGDDDVTQGDDDITMGDDDTTVEDDDATVGDDDDTTGDDDATAGDDDDTTVEDDDATVGDDDDTTGDDDATAEDDDATAGDDDMTIGDDDASVEAVTATPEPATPIPFVDQDGDGYPAWYTALDTPEVADCDDNDPAVNPTVERLVPEGWFWRGNDEFEDTSPMRQIWLSSYCLDVVPVTNREFAAFMNARVPDGLGEQTADGLPLFDFDDNDDEIPERILRDGQGGYVVMDGYEDHPVTEVYQWSGDTYCAAMGKRLPTEAEWEKGARGDQDTRDYPWGDEDATCDLANFSDLVIGDHGEVVEANACVGDTVPVGSYPNASPYGLLDMTGNVAEFVSDYYQADYYATSPDVDPQGPDSGWAVDPMNPDGFEAIVSRGGVWAAPATRVWERWAEPLDANSNGVSFRCARSLEAPSESMRFVGPVPTPLNWTSPVPPESPAASSVRPFLSYTRDISGESGAD